MNSASRDLLKIALERGYLEPDVVKSVAREAKIRRVTPERVLLERRILSVRRMERLRSHLRYTLTRRSDKVYGAMIVRKGIVKKRAVVSALKYQKVLFVQERRCVRLGSRLIEKGLITVEQDRQFRLLAKGREVPAEVRRESEASSTQALALDEESALRSGPGNTPPSSYAAIEAALARVDALKALRDDLSTSDTPGYEAPTPDSAAEFENALSMLARRRVGETPNFEESKLKAPVRKSAKRRKKSTGLRKIFDLVA